MSDAARQFVAPPPPQASVAVAGGTARFPVRRIICVGRNYPAHAREMGADPEREPPFFFMKPADAVCDGGAVPYPPLTRDLHHEVELVVALGQGGADIAPEAAAACIWGYGVGVDLTRRDLQGAAKAAGRPWEWGKAFDFSAPCGPLLPAAAAGDMGAAAIRLAVNGAVRQQGNTRDMIWPAAEIIAAASRAMRLAPGDLIFTGTPEGVGPLHPGDRVEARVAGLPPLAFTVTPAAREH
ncbi:fumarylacetoacetate hydrolase family protein [Camelimonas abortus]|uniref:Fumarylacetoacetate hydrolase family protein n=1 Tax=Camelimonas abortus TaxID=1017184 RepID=A0ABV7LGB1_9HYPH